MFFDKEEKIISSKFIKNGYVISKIENTPSLEYIKKIFYKHSSSYFKINAKNIPNFFNTIHEILDVSNLNDFRLFIHKKINHEKKFREIYYQIAKKYLNILVGNELVMQNKINLSIQLPGDKTSLLPIHSDTWSGDSPFEIVVWMPLVNCHGTKSMFILDPKETYKFYKNFAKYSTMNSFEIFKKLKNKLKWIKVNFGEILFFNQCLPHGNHTNTEKETRWSLNCRFKSLFSPYGDKKLGEFFQPINIRPLTLIGMEYKDPKS